MPSQNNIFQGRAAEFLAAFHLEMLGLRTSHVDLPYDDLWCSHPNGSIVRVQVKSTMRPFKRNDRRNETPRYNFKLDRKSPYDGVYIFAALDRKICIARRWDDTPPTTIKFNPELFTEDEMQNSFTKEFNL